MHEWVTKTLAASVGKSDREVRHSESTGEEPQGARCDPDRDRTQKLFFLLSHPHLSPAAHRPPLRMLLL